MREIRLHQMRKLRVHIQRVRDLRHTRRLFFLFFALALPKLLLLGLAGRGAAVDGGAGAVGEERGFGGGGAVVGGQERLTCRAEGAHGAEIELAEAIGVIFFGGGGDLRGAAVDGGSAHAHGRGVVDVGAGGAAAGVVSADGEGFVLGVVLRAGLHVLVQSHGAARADKTGGDVAGFVAEDEALREISTGVCR